jgi:hypothetical protein
MKTNSKISFLILVICIVGFGLFNIAASSSQKEYSKQDSPTPIQIGVMSEKQREHSKLYKKYNSDHKIPEILAREKGNDVEIFRLLPLGAGLPDERVPTAFEALNRITCSANFVVVGEVKSKNSQLTEDLSFVFTDYEFTVQDVLKNDISTPIQQNAEIMVTRPGGEVLLNNKAVRALDESFQPLKPGKKYVLFLQAIPQTGAFQTIESGDSFELKKERIINLKKDSLHKLTVEYNPSSFIEGIRQAAFYPCGKKNEGTQ